MKSLFASPATSQYPKGGLRLPEIERGCVAIDETLCTLCGLCQRRCPSGALIADRRRGKLLIDRMKCIVCGECVYECPENSLSMVPEYLPPDRSILVDVYRVKAVPGSQLVLNGIEMPPAVKGEKKDHRKSLLKARETQSMRRRIVRASEEAELPVRVIHRRRSRVKSHQ